MDYKIVELAEKTVVGITARTNNFSNEMGAVIGRTWQHFFNEAYRDIYDKVNLYTLGIYTDYSSDENDDYTFMSACEVTSESTKGPFEVRKVPAGRYAEFEIVGDMDTMAQLKEIQRLWQEIWTMDLDRSFVCDFEEYRSADPNRADIRVYIGLKG
ncbi:MAG: GyrI-like domain-containing protein [Oscillospiraceae bacterium]|nr:GyrI-like domain-containing protein [Oscillospiraceae bacterium]